MAFDSPPWAMDSTTQDAEMFRRAIGTLMGSGGGIVAAGDLNVTQQGTPNMSVLVGTGQCWVPGSSTASQGPYYSRNGAPVTLAISASNPSNPRIDTIVAQVTDQTYAGSGFTCAPTVIVGTPTAGATLVNLNGKGAVPASSLVLAYVLVPAAATSILTADIANVVSRLQPFSSGLSPLSAVATSAASFTAAAGQLVIASSASAQAITLPSPAANALVAVQAGTGHTGAAPVTVSTPSGSIIGAGVSASSIPLGTVGALVWLQSDGTNWYIVSGERDTGWVALTINVAAGFFDSAAGFPIAARLHGGWVELCGQIEKSGFNGIGGTWVTALPSQFRPAQDVFCSHGWTGPSATAGGAQLDITAAGVVSSSAPNGAAGTYWGSLDGIRYRIG